MRKQLENIPANSPEIAPDPLPEPELQKPGDDTRINSLLEKGISKSPEEAREFIKNLDDTFELHAANAQEIKHFTESFDRIISEALTQLESIRQITEGELINKNELLQNILTGIAENFESLKPEVEGIARKKSFSLIELPMKLGTFVKRNKAAFIAFNVFFALAKMGGSAEASGDVDHLHDTHETSGYLPEEHHPQDMAEALEHSLDYGADVDETGDKISQITEEIKEMKNNPDVMHFSLDSESGMNDSNVDADKLIGELEKNGELQLNFKSFFSSEMSESQTDQTNHIQSEMAFSILETPGDNAGSENSTEKIFDAQGQTREEALAGALNEVAHYQGTATASESMDYQSETETNSRLKYNEVLKTASDEIITVKDIEISADTKEDSEGNATTIYTAKAKARI